MEENKVVAYSFLSYLNNDMKGNGFNDIFIPLVKRTISIKNTLVIIYECIFIL